MASRPAPAADFEPAGELKIGPVGIANLRVRTLDVARLAEEMRSRVARAPKLFDRAAVILDFGGLAELPDTTTAQALIDALRDAGALPVALAWGSTANAELAEALDLPVLSKFRAQYENADAVAAPAPARAAPAPEPAAAQPAAKTAPAPANAEPGLIQAVPVRSGVVLITLHDSPRGEARAAGRLSPRGRSRTRGRSSTRSCGFRRTSRRRRCPIRRSSPHRSAGTACSCTGRRSRRSR